jgi:hypothetical protein
MSLRLVILFPLFGIHGSHEMQVSVATSLTLAVPSSLIVVLKHRRLGHFDAEYFWKWSMSLLAGVAIGIAAGPHLPQFALKIAFLVFVLLMIVYFAVLPKELAISREPPFGLARIGLADGVGASLERASEHPLARAIVKGAEKRGVSLTKPEEFSSLTGRGVTGRVNGKKVALGNRKLLDELGVDAAALHSRADALRAEGQTVMYLAVDGRAAGLLGVADPVKDSTPEALDVLHGEGVRVVMLTGDNRKSAQAVANRLGIDQV